MTKNEKKKKKKEKGGEDCKTYAYYLNTLNWMVFKNAELRTDKVSMRISLYYRNKDFPSQHSYRTILEVVAAIR